MNNFDICRVCLVGNVRMFRIEDTGLLVNYELLTNTKLFKGDGRPEKICYLCLALLKKCCKFLAMAQNSEWVLIRFLGLGIEINYDSISKLNSKLKPNYCTSNVKPITIIDYSNNKTTEVTMKSELKQEIIEINRHTYAETVQISDILKDFEEDFKNEHKDKDLEHPRMDNNDYNLSNDLEPIKDQDEDCIVLEASQPIISVEDNENKMQREGSIHLPIIENSPKITVQNNESSTKERMLDLEQLLIKQEKNDSKKSEPVIRKDESDTTSKEDLSLQNTANIMELTRHDEDISLEEIMQGSLKKQQNNEEQIQGILDIEQLVIKQEKIDSKELKQLITEGELDTSTEEDVFLKIETNKTEPVIHNQQIGSEDSFKGKPVNQERHGKMKQQKIICPSKRVNLEQLERNNKPMKSEELILTSTEIHRDQPKIHKEHFSSDNLLQALKNEIIRDIERIGLHKNETGAVQSAATIESRVNLEPFVVPLINNNQNCLEDSLQNTTNDKSLEENAKISRKRKRRQRTRPRIKKFISKEFINDSSGENSVDLRDAFTNNKQKNLLGQTYLKEEGECDTSEDEKNSLVIKKNARVDKDRLTTKEGIHDFEKPLLNQENHFSKQLEQPVIREVDLDIPMKKNLVINYETNNINLVSHNDQIISEEIMEPLLKYQHVNVDQKEEMLDSKQFLIKQEKLNYEELEQLVIREEAELVTSMQKNLLFKNETINMGLVKHIEPISSDETRQGSLKEQKVEVKQKEIMLNLEQLPIKQEKNDSKKPEQPVIKTEVELNIPLEKDLLLTKMTNHMDVVRHNELMTSEEMMQGTLIEQVNLERNEVMLDIKQENIDLAELEQPVIREGEEIDTSMEEDLLLKNETNMKLVINNKQIGADKIIKYSSKERPVNVLNPEKTKQNSSENKIWTSESVNLDQLCLVAHNNSKKSDKLVHTSMKVNRDEPKKNNEQLSSDNLVHTLKAEIIRNIERIGINKNENVEVTTTVDNRVNLEAFGLPLINNKQNCMEEPSLAHTTNDRSLKEHAKISRKRARRRRARPRNKKFISKEFINDSSGENSVDLGDAFANNKRNNLSGQTLSKEEGECETSEDEENSLVIKKKAVINKDRLKKRFRSKKPIHPVHLASRNALNAEAKEKPVQNNDKTTIYLKPAINAKPIISDNIEYFKEFNSTYTLEKRVKNNKPSHSKPDINAESIDSDGVGFYNTFINTGSLEKQVLNNEPIRPEPVTNAEPIDSDDDDDEQLIVVETSLVEEFMQTSRPIKEDLPTVSHLDKRPSMKKIDNTHYLTLTNDQHNSDESEVEPPLVIDEYLSSISDDDNLNELSVNPTESIPSPRKIQVSSTIDKVESLFEPISSEEEEEVPSNDIKNKSLFVRYGHGTQKFKRQRLNSADKIMKNSKSILRRPKSRNAERQNKSKSNDKEIVEVHNSIPSKTVDPTKENCRYKKPDVKSYQCNKCDSKFVAKENLNDHLKFYHSRDKPEYSCSICRRKYTSERDLKEHHERRHSQQTKSYSCDQCHKIFRRRSSFKIHTLFEHEPDDSK